MNIISEILHDLPFVSATFKLDLYPSTNIMLQTGAVPVRLFSKYRQDTRLPKCHNYFNRLSLQKFETALYYSFIILQRASALYYK
jgi:hypothetical protein